MRRGRGQARLLWDTRRDGPIKLSAPLCIRFSESQRVRLREAAVRLSEERGQNIDESTLVRELTMRGVNQTLAAAS